MTDFTSEGEEDKLTKSEISGIVLFCVFFGFALLITGWCAGMYVNRDAEYNYIWSVLERCEDCYNSSELRFLPDSGFMNGAVCHITYGERYEDLSFEWITYNCSRKWDTYDEVRG